MHVIRPKSAKGRTRPQLTEDRSTHDELLHDRHPLSPHPPSRPPRPRPTPSHRFDSSLSPRTYFRRTSPCSTVEATFTVPMPSLNKFKVLPSIEKRSEEVSRTDTEIPKHDPQMDTASNRTVQPVSRCQDSETGGPLVLLALRTPCGQRLKCQFKASDTLQHVVATAEDLSGKPFKHVLIETMEVPRKSFTNLNMTLCQCGVVNKSVLCISFKDGP